MPFSVTKQIAEGDVAATLKAVLQEVVKQNRACTVLTRSTVEGLGTEEARVILTFDDAKCEKSKPAG
ncbi:MAG: hypothetical protein ABI645_05360 [Pseudomonadota bacterium]